MTKKMRILWTLFWMTMVTQTTLAIDYTTILTPENGFTEVTSIDGILTDDHTVISSPLPKPTIYMWV